MVAFQALYGEMIPHDVSRDVQALMRRRPDLHPIDAVSICMEGFEGAFT
jgi:hypothetical protein